jgi:hypothetical protein
MSRLTDFFARNLTLKLSAIGIALLLWASVRVEAPNRQSLPGVPVRVDLADPNWALLGDPLPATVVVRFGGPSGELMRLAAERPSVVVPMDVVTSGDTTIILRNSWVRVQDRPGVIVEDIQPSSVRITFEPVQRANLPLAPRFRGELPDRLALAAEPTVEPGEVRVTGPLSRLSEMDSVQLFRIDLSTMTGSRVIQVGVDTTGMSGLLLQPVSAQVDVKVEERVEQVISGIPVVFPDVLVADDLYVTPETLVVMLRGARSIVENADPSGFRAVIDVNADELPEPGAEAQFPVQLQGLPPLLTGELQVVRVTVRRAGGGERP